MVNIELDNNPQATYPEDVMKVATEVGDRISDRMFVIFGRGEIEDIARAILAERERCAQIIEKNMLCEADDGEVIKPRSNPRNRIGLAYATAIRKGDRT